MANWNAIQGWEVARFVRLYEAGLSTREIGQACGRAQRAVHRQLQRAGVSLRGFGSQGGQHPGLLRVATYPCGRKFCPRCGRWRLLLDFAARRFGPTGQPEELHSYCRACVNTLSRERRAYEATIPAKREELRQYNREYRRRARTQNGTRSHVEAAQARWGTEPVILGRRICRACGRWRSVLDFTPNPKTGAPLPRCQACIRAANRASYRRMLEDAERHERRKEYSRIYGEARRRAAGVPARQWSSWDRLPDHNRLARLKIEPLAEVVLRELRAATLRELAERSGVPERRIYQVTHYETAFISATVADRLLVACGVSLVSAYPDVPLYLNKEAAR